MSNTITLQFLTLADIKAQARIEPEDTSEDTYLLLLGRAAERKVFNDTQRTYDEIVAKWGVWPEDLTLAALLLVTNWYKNRESTTNQSMSVVPYGYDGLYMEYRKGTYSSIGPDDDVEETQAELLWRAVDNLRTDKQDKLEWATKEDIEAEFRGEE